MSRQIQNEFNQYFKDIIKEAFDDAIKKQDKTDEPFFVSQYPFLEDDFIDALNEIISNHPEGEGVFLTKESLKLIDSTTINVDSDGFPYIISMVEIPDLDLKYNIIVYHHSEWDFYFNN